MIGVIDLRFFILRVSGLADHERIPVPGQVRWETLTPYDGRWFSWLTGWSVREMHPVYYGSNWREKPLGSFLKSIKIAVHKPLRLGVGHPLLVER